MLIRSVGAIGDVHAEDLRLERALAWLGGLALDAVLAVGDIVDGPGDPERCAKLLGDAGARVVRGNHDRWLLEGTMRDLRGATQTMSPELRAYLSALPSTLAFTTVTGPALLCHGLGADDMVRLGPDDFGYALETNDALAELRASDVRVAIVGHTHRRMVRSFGALTVINVGTLYREHRPCACVVDFEQRRVRFRDFDTTGALSAEETTISF